MKTLTPCQDIHQMGATTMKTTRRDFIKSTTAVAGFCLLPSGLLAKAPNSKLCTAQIGLGSRGKGDLSLIADNDRTEVVGLCDVDVKQYSEKLKKTYPNAKFYQDYRVMLSELGDRVDAVAVSTPDHTHFHATMAAMAMGKHVYTQKPLTHTVAEARSLKQAARARGLKTQMGIQNQSSLFYRMTKDRLQQGVIGKVSKVYVWSYKNWGYDGLPYQGSDPIPEGLNWDLWLGSAPKRSYLKGKYHRSQWRRMMDFGCGTLGDMGVHIFDTPLRSLALKAPTWIQNACREPSGYGFPEINQVSYGFEGTQYTTDTLEWTWYDGALVPQQRHPDMALPEGHSLPSQGALLVGERGRMVLPHCSAPIFYPMDIHRRLKKLSYEKISHYDQWVNAIFDSSVTPTANFDYASHLTETVLLGGVASRFPNQRLTWDAQAMKVANIESANQSIRHAYRTDY